MNGFVGAAEDIDEALSVYGSLIGRKGQRSMGSATEFIILVMTVDGGVAGFT